jgi:hypothetical protein
MAAGAFFSRARRCLWRLIRSPAGEIDDEMTVFMASVPRRARGGRRLASDRKFSLQERSQTIQRIEAVCRQNVSNVLAAQKYDRMPVPPYFFVCLSANGRSGDQDAELPVPYA